MQASNEIYPIVIVGEETITRESFSILYIHMYLQSCKEFHILSITIIN